MNKQCRSRSDATESGSTLFATFSLTSSKMYFHLNFRKSGKVKMFKYVQVFRANTLSVMSICATRLIESIL